LKNQNSKLGNPASDMVGFFFGSSSPSIGSMRSARGVARGQRILLAKQDVAPTPPPLFLKIDDFERVWITLSFLLFFLKMIVV